MTARQSSLLVTLAIVLVTSSVTAGWLWHRDEGDRRVVLGLLLPDDASLADPRVTAWLDAAREIGLLVEPIRDSRFLGPFADRRDYAGVVLADGVHKEANALLVTRLDDYVRSGGKLMLAFDAATLDSASSGYAPERSRLSPMVGIDYALYDSLGSRTTRVDSISCTEGTLRELHIPPGKFVEEKGVDKLVLANYLTGVNHYAHYVTRGDYPGTTLMGAEDGSLIAGINRVGGAGGQVLFVNLPLGYLKVRTDGLLLHSFLRYFASDVAGMPMLSNAPEGKGGLVMNLHVDAAPALPAIVELYNKSSLFSQGPYSIHVTAGPDVTQPGDGRGLNVPGNLEMQKWLRYFVDRGDQVGSHGGWIHNYFGAYVEQGPPETFTPYLEMNKSALEQATGRPVIEYSAPQGAHPAWVTDWLDRNGIVAYYYTGNAGMGPTRSYREDRRTGNKAWAFPVMSFGTSASFEEMHADGVTNRDVADWLVAMTRFVSANEAIRLVYSHPPGFLYYLPAIERWLQETARLAKEGRYSWYTMSDVATFLNRREQVEWQATSAAGQLRIRADHPHDLKRQTWILPAARYGRPVVRQGEASVQRREQAWLVVDQGGKSLDFVAKILADHRKQH